MCSFMKMPSFVASLLSYGEGQFLYSGAFSICPFRRLIHHPGAFRFVLILIYCSVGEDKGKKNLLF